MLTWYRQETLITYFTQRSTPLKEKNRLDNGQDATNLEINILGKLNISKNSGRSSKFPGGLNVIHTTTQTAFVTPVREYFF